MERGYLFALGAAVTWGLMYAIEGKILTKISPLTLLFCHFFLTTLIALPFFFAHGSHREIPQNSSVILPIVLTAILSAVANFWILSSIRILGASTASIFEISYPLFVVLFSIVLFGTRVSLPTIGGGILIGLGTLIVIRYG